MEEKEKKKMLIFNCCRPRSINILQEVLSTLICSVDNMEPLAELDNVVSCSHLGRWCPMPLTLVARIERR